MVKSAGAHLHDGFAHDILLHYDAGSGQFSVSVDGQVHDTDALVGPLDTAPGRDMTLGGAFGRQPFDGQMSDFALRADAGLYSYGADLDILDPVLAAPAPAGSPAPDDAIAPVLAPAPADSDTLLNKLIQKYADAGQAVIQGTTGDDVLRAKAAGSVLVGGDGNDRLRESSGDDVLAGGAGADQFVFDLRTAGGPSRDVITDLDFTEGDVLRILWNLPDGGIRLQTLADLDLAIQSGLLDVVEQPDGQSVTIAAAIAPDRVLELAFLDGMDLLA